MQIPYARMRPNVTDWKVGGSATDNTGAVIGGASPTGPTTWSSGTNDYVLTANNQISYQAVVLVAAPNTSTPLIGRMKLDEVSGMICVSSPIAAGRQTVAVGIYVSEFNSNTNKWDVRDPLNPSDASRDDYFYLEASEMQLPAAGAATGNAGFCFDLKLANPIIIGGGQALHVTVSYQTDSGVSVRISSMFRTRCGPVA
jgi:hypothetical protein